MSQEYSNPKRADDPHVLPDVEVFKVTAGELGTDDEGNPYPSGWYWQSCFPGCLPDSEPMGPFATYAEALADAQEGADDE